MPKYTHLILPRYGLCNKLLTWAKAMVLSQQTERELLVRGWTHLSLGPWIRHEKSKRWYAGMLTETGLLKFWLTKLTSNDSVEYKTLLGGQFNVDRFKETPYISDFPSLAKHRNFIKEEFYRMIKPNQLTIIHETPSPLIGIHIRRGDYVTIGSTTDLSYFRDTIEQLRFLLGNEAPVTIFTDGTREELSTLLTMPSVELFESKNDLVDLVVLSRSKVLITSKASSYSYWAAFMSDGVVIHHPDTWVKQCRPERINREIFEGVVSWNQKLPTLLIDSINHIKKISFE